MDIKTNFIIRRGLSSQLVQEKPDLTLAPTKYSSEDLKEVLAALKKPKPKEIKTMSVRVGQIDMARIFNLENFVRDRHLTLLSADSQYAANTRQDDPERIA